ncbi:hypothetical protein FN846DRAFT_951204 [Sphaerosporella brunnea]|uniref:Uncharacterized protein n=1 Tax=Sphaerosporella brunnea TaxID=1250544 RepID=A0A5J5EVW1_9PEZI|nr:hypothetical protein FN846DRAFT_951204 [Sphaerosporella brunnea]
MLLFRFLTLPRPGSAPTLPIFVLLPLFCRYASSLMALAVLLLVLTTPATQITAIVTAMTGMEEEARLSMPIQQSIGKRKKARAVAGG